MDKLVQLQAALRAIETGKRLESVDNVLVRQVLQQPRAQPQQSTHEPAAKDIYRELQALRKAKAKAGAKQSVGGNDTSGKSGDVGAMPPSPKSIRASLHRSEPNVMADARLELAPSSPERHRSNNNDKNIANELVVSTTETIELMQKALFNREKELKRSEKAVARADAELREELSRAEKILPTKFLFERNLASDRSNEAARNVLLRFQHRFYKLYFRQWWRATLELRLQAHCRAAAKIVRVYRGHRGRQEARRLRRELNALQTQKRLLLVFRMRYRSSQAMKLQMAWRRYLRHRAIKYRQARQAAASFLQQAFRTRQWRGQSLVTSLTNARKLFATVSVQKLYRGRRARRKLAEAKRRQQQEERVRLALLRNMSKQARAAWLIERCGAGYLIAHRVIFPYAMRLRWRRAVYQLRRQVAAECIARVICKWFGVEARREAARAKQVNEWFALVQREHKRSRSAAILIQKHLRRWVQQRKFLMAQARRKKLARNARLADKACRLEHAQQHKGPGWLGSDRKSLAAATSAQRKTSRFMSNNSLGPQPARLMSFLKPVQLKGGITKTTRRTDVEAAALVQRSFRRYCARKQARILAWKKEVRSIEARVLQRRNAATEIQRRVRGIAARKLARQCRADRLLLRFILRWKWRRIQKRQCAARKIVRWFKHKRMQQLARLWHIEKQNRLAASFRIKRWYRVRCLLPSRLNRVVRIVQKRDDTFVFYEQSLQVCRQHMADEFAVGSFGASLEDALRPLLSDLTATSRSPSKCQTSPTKQKLNATISRKHHLVAFPVFQMMFLVASGWKMPFVWRELDGKTIFQIKLERAKAVAFFRSLNKRGKPVDHQIKQSPTTEAVLSVPSPTRRTQKSPVKGSVAVETFSSVDVDVAVARSTSGAKGALDFAAFVRVIGLLGEISLAQQSPTTTTYWGRYDGTEARILALLWFSLLPHPSMQPLTLQFEAFVSNELSRRATCLKRLFTRQHNKLHGAAMLVEMRRNLRNEELSRAAVVLQTQARTLLARREFRRRMKQTYEKFLDPTWGLPYWMNPRSGYSTWLKPRHLGAEDVCSEPVPFPPPERTLKAPCNGKNDCDRCAEWVCYDCDEFFCLGCFGEYHKAKTIFIGEEDSKEDRSVDEDENAEEANVKREHELERLQLCGLCEFQLASRRCLDCVPKVDSKPKPKAKPRSAKPGKQKDKQPLESTSNDKEELRNSESLFCDVCFGFLHHHGGLKAHRTEPLLELCNSCIPDDEDNNSAASHKQPTTKYEIFGVGDAVQWECEACGDQPRRVCGRCALQYHPKESCDELCPVPLQTLGRRQRTERLRDEQEARDRADLEKIRARNLRVRQERCARKLQSFWRSQAPIRRARRLVAARRKETSELWLRCQEDVLLAKRMTYRAKNLLGMASPLATDSPVESRLRSLHALARRQLIIRARFFGLLIDEYVTVGVPLPGIGLLHPGSNEIWTSEDLRGWIRNRQTIRLKKLTPQEIQPAERALCAWRQLERWSKAEIENQGNDSEAQPPEATQASWLTDVHPKQVITERMVPLAQPYDPPLPKKKRRKAADEEEDIVEDVPVAMFLVEFSLDPKRTVWINHSLAERFWEWKRLKLLARNERGAQRQRARNYEKQQKEREDKRKQDEERNNQVNIAGAMEAPPEVEHSTTVNAAPNAAGTVAEQPWATSTSAWTEDGAATDAYYNYDYYPSTDPNTAADAWAGYDGYSPSYPASYDYNSTVQTATVLPEEGLVDSEHYYATGDYTGGNSNGSDTSNWYGTEYSAYEMSGYRPAATGSDNSGWASSQLSIDSNVWYDNTEVTSYTYDSTDQWQQSAYTQPTQDHGSNDSYSIELPSAANGYYGPYTDDQKISAPQSEWEEVFDPVTQQSYYVNRVTNETAWHIPD